MRLHNIALSIITIVSCCVLPSAAIAEMQWKISPARTSVDFAVKHLMLMEVEGKFRSPQGTVVTQSKTDFSNAKVTASIPVSTISTGNEDRDAHLLQKVFFNAEKYPTMDFRSTSVKATGKDTYEMRGMITIRGVSRPILFEVHKSKLLDLKDGKACCHFVATAKLNRYDFGLKWNDLTETGGMVVDDMVKIQLKVTMLSA
ncbi:MAG: YceI family protein [Bdellovibrionales bacterium]|nr:YceI family protein [Bdellovibrionales bacterium]